MHTATTEVIDLSSDDETSKQPPIVFIPVQQKTISPKPTALEKDLKKTNDHEDVNDIEATLMTETNLPWCTKSQLKFIDHVVMIWLNRARRGDRRITMPDSILKAKAKEAAKIVNREVKFFPKHWLPVFLKKLDHANSLGPQKHLSYTSFPSMLISDIVKEEWSKFFATDNPASSNCELIIDENQLELIEVTEMSVAEGSVISLEGSLVEVVDANQLTKKDKRKVISTDPEVLQQTQEDLCDIPKKIRKLSSTGEDIINNPIQSYEEALTCLRLVEKFAMCMRNFKAVGLISQMENLLKDE